MIVELVIAVLSFVAGVFANHYFARRGSEELQREASELRRLNTLMLHSMEQAGWIKLNRNHFGKILGFEQSIQPAAIESAEALGQAKLEAKPPVQVIKPTAIESEEGFGRTQVRQLSDADTRLKKWGG